MTLEEPLYMLRPTRTASLDVYALAAMPLALIVALSFVNFPVPFWSIWAASGLAVVLLGSIEYNRLSSRYKITPSQIVVEDGIVSKRRFSLFLNNVTDVTVRQSNLQRILGYGTVIAGSASGIQQMQLSMTVRKPRELAQRLEHLIREYTHLLSRRMEGQHQV